MGLRNLAYATKDVEIPGGGSFAVGGLAPDMVITLYNRHAGQLSMLFDNVMAQGADAIGDTQSLIASLIGDAPAIMAELIAIASGSDPNATYVDLDTKVNPLGLTDFERDLVAARKLSLPVQVDALSKIADLTFTSSMPAGKFLAVVVKMASTTTAALSSRNA